MSHSVSMTKSISLNLKKKHFTNLSSVIFEKRFQHEGIFLRSILGIIQLILCTSQAKFRQLYTTELNFKRIFFWGGLGEVLLSL